MWHPLLPRSSSLWSDGGFRAVVLVTGGRKELFPASQVYCLSPLSEPVGRAHRYTTLCFVLVTAVAGPPSSWPDARAWTACLQAGAGRPGGRCNRLYNTVYGLISEQPARGTEPLKLPNFPTLLGRAGPDNPAHLSFPMCSKLHTNPAPSTALWLLGSLLDHPPFLCLWAA